MDVYHPDLLPEEIIRIADYYSSWARHPFDLRAWAGDPLGWYDLQSSRHKRRTGITGEWSLGKCITPQKGAVIKLYLERIASYSHSRFPWPMGLWLTVLETLLHEIAHHLQVKNPQYFDDYDAVGYWDSWPERDARQFARHELYRLSMLDRDLFMPRHNRDWGYLGILLSRYLRAHEESVWENNSWNSTNLLRQARLRAIHIPAKSTWARFAEQEGIVWRDRLGRQYRHLTLAQEIQCGNHYRSWFDILENTDIVEDIYQHSGAELLSSDE